MKFQKTKLTQSWLLAVLAVSLSAGKLLAAESEVTIQKDGQAIRVGILGDDGKEYSLEAVETFLNKGRTWRSLATVAPRNQPVFLYDPTCAAKPQNFYRLRLLQGAAPVEVANFRLLDLEGRAHELFYQTDQKAVVLVLCGNDLASLNQDVASLKMARDSYQRKGVSFWLVLTRANLDRAEVLQQAASLGLDFTILEDEGGAVTRQLAAGDAPEAIVVNPASWSIAYKGRIADNVEIASGKTTHALLADALEALLAGNRQVVKQTAVSGVALGVPSYADRTYAQHIAPLLQAKCVRCHNPGNIAPWIMTNHAAIQLYAPLIKDSVLTRRMPPWQADPHFQAFANSEMLSADELAMLTDWIDRGAPRGTGTDPLAESVPPPPPDWPLGTPDQIVGIDRQDIPTSGTVDYRYLVVANPYPNDVWLKATVVKPGNRRVVHHVLVFSASSFADVLQIQAGLGGYFAAYVPGQEQVAFPQGTGKLMKRGAYLVFQLHYTATGTAETDLTQLGFYVSSTPPASQLRTVAAYDLKFTIPPGASDHPGSAEYVLTKDIVLHEMSPHMHFRGSRFRFDAIYADGSKETLLNVPFYRFAWQSLYRLAEPKRLPAGTRIVCSGGWDNSAKNAFNPDPSASVQFGEQSWDEMFIGYFNYSDPQ